MKTTAEMLSTTAQAAVSFAPIRPAMKVMAAKAATSMK